MNYIESLKIHKIKVTPHKLAILELFNHYRHLDATQIVQKLYEKTIIISPATVYRILASFESKLIISKHNFRNEQAIYELNIENSHHDHLICLKCGGVMEFNNQQIEDLQQIIAKNKNFQLVSHSLNIYGYCNLCK